MEMPTPTGISVKCDNCTIIEFQGKETENAFRHRIWTAGWEKPEKGIDLCRACAGYRKTK
jgi:hypothetical protein